MYESRTINIALPYNHPNSYNEQHILLMKIRKFIHIGPFRYFDKNKTHLSNKIDYYNLMFTFNKYQLDKISKNYMNYYQCSFRSLNHFYWSKKCHLTRAKKDTNVKPIHSSLNSQIFL